MKHIVMLLKSVLVAYADTAEVAATALRKQAPVAAQTLSEMKKEFIDAATELNLFSDFERSYTAQKSQNAAFAQQEGGVPDQGLLSLAPEVQVVPAQRSAAIPTYGG